VRKGLGRSRSTTRLRPRGPLMATRPLLSLRSGAALDKIAFLRGPGGRSMLKPLAAYLAGSERGDTEARGASWSPVSVPGGHIGSGLILSAASCLEAPFPATGAQNPGTRVSTRTRRTRSELQSSTSRHLRSRGDTGGP